MKLMARGMVTEFCEGPVVETFGSWGRASRSRLCGRADIDEWLGKDDLANELKSTSGSRVANGVSSDSPPVLAKLRFGSAV